MGRASTVVVIQERYDLFIIIIFLIECLVFLRAYMRCIHLSMNQCTRAAFKVKLKTHNTYSICSACEGAKMIHIPNYFDWVEEK